MDAKLMAKLAPELGTEEELAASLKLFESIPKIDLYTKRVVCLPSGFGLEPHKGHILIESVSAENIVEGPIAALELDAESCKALLKSLLVMRKMFKMLEEHRAAPAH